MVVDFIDLKSQYEKISKDLSVDFNNILNSCQFILGPVVNECEANLQKYSGAEFALTCANGTDALVMALMALGIGAGDEVVVPGFTFFATAEAVSLVGAKPIFCDVERDSFNICLNSLEQVISEKTKAVICVGLYGQMAEMDTLERLCEKNELALIEDAAQCFGASFKGKKSCSLAKISTTSFFPAKPLGCYGDGGAVFTNDRDLFEILKQIRVHGDRSRYDHIRMGINGRMDALQCAVINQKLKIFDWEVEQRNLVASRYYEGLSDLSDIDLPQILEARTSVWAQYTVVVDDRESLQKALAKDSVPTSIHYPLPVYQQPVYKDLYRHVDLKNCEYLAARVLSLPMHPYLKPEQQAFVIEKVRSYFA